MLRFCRKIRLLLGVFVVLGGLVLSLLVVSKRRGTVDAVSCRIQRVGGICRKAQSLLTASKLQQVVKVI